MVDRYQRMCPDHGRVLDEGLCCPVGGHHVQRWVVVDTEKHETWSGEVDIERGELEAMRKKLTPAPRRAARRPVRERQEPVQELAEKPVESKTVGVLKKAPFTGTAGQLVVRMARRKNGLYQVSWALKATSGKQSTGLLYRGEERSEAYDAWGRAMNDAKAQSWQERSAYTPIPSAGLAAARDRGGAAARTPAPARAGAKPAGAVRKCGNCRRPGHRRETCSEKSTNKPAGKRGAQAA